MRLVCKHGITKDAGRALVSFALTHSAWHGCLENAYELGRYVRVHDELGKIIPRQINVVTFLIVNRNHSVLDWHARCAQTTTMSSSYSTSLSSNGETMSPTRSQHWKKPLWHRI